MAPNVAVGAYPFRALSLVKIFCMLKFLVDFILSKAPTNHNMSRVNS